MPSPASVLAQTFLVCLVCLVWTPCDAAHWTYAGQTLTDTQWNAVIDAAAHEITQFAPYASDCGVVYTHVSSEADDGIDAHPFDLPGRVDPDGPHGVNLARFVQTTTQARHECASYWPCAAVQVFTLPEVNVLLAVYYTSGDVDAAPVLIGGGGDPDADSTRWVATVALTRTQGYACPATAAQHVDPVQFYTMWAGRFNDVLTDVTDYLTVKPGDILTEPQILQHSAAITNYFNTYGHLYRMWPNANCSLTPILYDPATNCLAARCPATTVCPSGYRLRSEAWNSCHGGWGGDEGQERVVAAQYAPTIDVDAETLTWTWGQTPFLDDAERTMSWYNTLRYKTPGENLPCGADKQKGVCAHDWNNDPDDKPTCVCTGTAVTVHGDVACQFDGADSLVYDTTLGDCITPEPGNFLCFLQGTCTFFRDAITWGATDVFGSGNVVSCNCTEPFVAPKCMTTLCDAGGDIGDCQLRGRGVCDLGAVTPGAWGCDCFYPFFGEHCEHEDNLSVASNNVTNACYIQESQVEEPPEGTLPESWLLCSGYGSCQKNENGTACDCPPTRSGPRCEYIACDHVADCGYLGACVHSYDTNTGRAQTDCICAAYTTVPDIPLAALNNGRCTVDLCDEGIYTPVTQPVDGVFNIKPLGNCDCTSAVTPPDPQLITVTLTTVTDVNGSDTTLAVPSHPWLPTLWEADDTSPTGQSPFIPSVRVANTGIRCDTPTCPVYVHPDSAAVLTSQCGVEALTVDSICLPCDTFTEMGLCRQTTGFGGVCDCDGAVALAYQKDIARADGRPQTEIDAMVAYYLEGTNTRYTKPDHPNDAMCTPYCKNGGVWDTTGAACNCAGTGFTGEDCTDPRCPNGVWTPDAVGDCKFCNTGWWPPEACNTCADGYVGPACDVCDDGYYHAQGTSGPCVPCDQNLDCNPAPGATLRIDCTDASQSSPPTCVCGDKYTGRTCHDCSDGYAAFDFLPGFCFECSTLLGCDPTGTLAVECTTTTQRCICTDPFLEPTTHKCGRCVDGYLKSGDACVQCETALGCFPPGTLGASCRMRNPNDAHCLCDTEAGYTGDVCDTCDEANGWFWYDNACVKCDHDCGEWGTPVCPGKLPGCTCTHGRSGTDCDQCTGCGVGGDCATDPTDTNWCVCKPGYTRNPTAVALYGPTALPCDTCDPTSHMTTPNGTCVSVVDACGDPAVTGVDVTLSVSNGECRCRPGWVDPPTEPGPPMCRMCSAGHAGPACSPCTPACQPPYGTCRWNPHTGTSTCECQPGHDGPTCEDCADGYVPVGDGTCAPCPVCGLHGTCAWNTNSSMAVCVCDPVHQHAVIGDQTSSCDPCAAHRSPMTCSECPTCPLNAICVEPILGTVTCACRPEFRHLAQFTNPLLHPCFSPTTAVVLEALPDIESRVMTAILGSTLTPQTLDNHATTNASIHISTLDAFPVVNPPNHIVHIQPQNLDTQNLSLAAALSAAVLFLATAALAVCLQVLVFKHPTCRHTCCRCSKSRSATNPSDPDERQSLLPTPTVGSPAPNLSDLWSRRRGDDDDDGDDDATSTSSRNRQSTRKRRFQALKNITRNEPHRPPKGYQHVGGGFVRPITKHTQL